MIVELIISELDFYLIEKVRELRKKENISQVQLAQKIGVSEGFIGLVENPKQNHKYNIRMLNRIANALKLKSYFDLFPDKVLSNDIVKIKIELFDSKNKDRNSRFKSVKITSCTDSEIEEYNKKQSRSKSN
ncbi:helix-turn-helix transcriptional regulator [Flavobacterium sp. KACC 22763]|uniref:helix-turn-helix transcriptional regulator n=1 Tax=Flavobacterium sp. KACC 22763 TaxID=3025668 RepID=UPI00236597B8|nr:helix-turn-helix domain-containing protein [Flavobacterium sp. KACC 22763]WDF66106.1 helix-turn-helix domain-containing protein [Flavobacterium sp. KACC 22763]